MAAEQDVGGIALGLTLETSGWSAGIARAKSELEGLKRSAAGLEIGVGVATRGGARSATAVGGPAAVAGIPGGGGIGAASPVISPKFQVSAQSVRQLRVDINAQLRALGVSGEAVAVPIKLGRVPYATMRTEIATGIGEVPIRIKPDAGSLTAFANVLSAMTGSTPGRARQAITAAAASRGIPARAQGGPAAANRPHLVGENGPEIHWPSSSGTYIAPRRAIGGAARMNELFGHQIPEREITPHHDAYRRISEAAARREINQWGGNIWYPGRRRALLEQAKSAGHLDFGKGIGPLLRSAKAAVAVPSIASPGVPDRTIAAWTREILDAAKTARTLPGQPPDSLEMVKEIQRRTHLAPGRSYRDLTKAMQVALGMRTWQDVVGTSPKVGPFLHATMGRRDALVADSHHIDAGLFTGKANDAAGSMLGPTKAFPMGRPSRTRAILLEASRRTQGEFSDVWPEMRSWQAGIWGEHFVQGTGTKKQPIENAYTNIHVPRFARGNVPAGWAIGASGLLEKRAGGGGVRPFCATCGTNIRDPRTHQSTAKHQANARGTSSSKWLSQQPPWAYGYRNQDAQYDPPGFEPNTDWWEGKARGGWARKLGRMRDKMALNWGDPSSQGETFGYSIDSPKKMAQVTRERGPMLPSDFNKWSSGFTGGVPTRQCYGCFVKSPYQSEHLHSIRAKEFGDPGEMHLTGQMMPEGELLANLRDETIGAYRPMGADAGRGFSNNALGGPVHRMAGGPAFKPVKSDAFYGAVARATQVTRASGRRVGETVHLYGQDEYGEMRTFLSADGTAGYAIKPDGDLVSVFNIGGPGGGKRALRSAIQRGATKLDAFDEAAPTFALGKVDPRDQQKNLPRFYEKFGFREVGRDPWDPQYAPEGWKGGTPDVVYMERQRKARRALGGAVDYDDISPLKDFDHPIYKAERPGPLLLASWKKAATEHMMGQGWDADDAKQWLANEAASFDMKSTAQAPLRLRTSGAMRDVAGMSSNDNDRIFAQMRADVAIKSKYINSPRGQADLLERAMRPDHNVDPITRRLPKGVKIRFSPEFSDYPDPSRFIRSGGAGYHGPDWGQRDRWSDPGQLTMGYFQPVVRNMNSLISALAPGGTQPFFEPRGEAEPFRKRWGSLSEWLKQGKWGEDASGFGAGSRARLAAYALDPKNRVLAHTLVEATKQIPQYGPHAGQSVDALHSDYVWTSPQMRGKGLASAMYSRIEKLTGMPIAPSSSQTPYGRRLWSRPASERSFGRAFGSRSPMPEDAESISMHDRWPSGIDEHGWRSGAEALGVEAFRDFSTTVDPLDRPRRPRRSRGQMKLPGFAQGGWAKGDFFQQAGGRSLGMWKGRGLTPEDSIAWETQLHEGKVGNLTMADIFGGSGSQWRTMGRPDRGPDRNRAEGGDVGKYIIGEIGRELFVPKRMEGIIPPDVAAQIPGTEELLANLMMGRARMSGGGVKEIGGKGSQQWDAPEDGWIIPNRLMHRIARSKGGGVHRHGNTWHNAQGKFASVSEIAGEQQRQANNAAQLQRRGEAVNQRSAAARQTAGVQSSAALAETSYAAAFGGMGTPGAGQDLGLAEANISAASVRGLTARSSLGGLFGYAFGGRARKSARLEAGAISREYKALPAPKGRDPLEAAEERLGTAKTELEGFNEQLGKLNTTTKTGKKDFADLTQVIQKAQRTVGIEAENVKTAANLRIREQDALARASGGAVQNFAAVTAAGFAFNVGMQAVSVSTDLAVKALEPVIDRMTGFTAVSQQVSKALAEGLPQAGTLSTLFGQRGIQAGISGRSASVFEDILGGGVLAKAGATKAQDASQLIRAAFGNAAPSGLTGGYGGIGGGSLFAEQLGGGKGLLEQIAQDVSVTRGGQEGPTGGIDAMLQAGVGAAGRQLRNEIRNNLGPAGGFLGPKEDVLNPVIAIDDNQRKAQLESIGIYNEATQRGARATGELGATLEEDAAAAAKVAAATANSTNEAERFANQMASVGVVFKDTSGNVLTTRKELEKATGVIARGLAIPDQAAFAKSQAQGLAANRQAASARGQLERDVLIPGQLGQQIAANPFTAATSGLAKGFQPTLVNLTRIQSLQNEITKDAQAGVEAQAQLVDTELGATQGAQFRGYMTDVSAYGQQIAGLNEQLANRQAQLGLHQFNFQLRVLNRNIRDARGLAGMAGGSRLGGIQREQYDLGRESQRLSLESQRLANEMAQRQINFQVAVAGFQAPGITGQERAARMEEAQVEASFAQQQLDIQKRQTGIGGQQYGLEGEAFRIQTAIAVQDLEAQRGILIESHQLEQEQIAVQKQINALTVRQAQVQAKAQSLFAEATGSFDANLGAASQYVAQFGGTIASALHAVRRAIDVLTGRSTSGTPTQPTTRAPGKKGAAGLIFNTTGETDLTVGEAGGEHVAVLRNPRKVDIGGPGGLSSPGGGSSGTTIQIVVTGNTISSDMDLETITRKVQNAVEDGLSRKANLLSVGAA